MSPGDTERSAGGFVFHSLCVSRNFNKLAPEDLCLILTLVRNCLGVCFC